jgi:hypothetical protein
MVHSTPASEIPGGADLALVTRYHVVDLAH